LVGVKRSTFLSARAESGNNSLKGKRSSAANTLDFPSGSYKLSRQHQKFSTCLARSLLFIRIAANSLVSSSHRSYLSGRYLQRIGFYILGKGATIKENITQELSVFFFYQNRNGFALGGLGWRKMRRGGCASYMVWMPADALTHSLRS
jgi:hypothetical protein